MFHVMVQWLDEGKTRARFSLPGREEWKAEHIDSLLQVLGEIRAEMAPAVPEEPPASVPFLHAPRYRTTLHEFSGGSLMEFRHPALGWLPFSCRAPSAGASPSLSRRRKWSGSTGTRPSAVGRS